MLNTKTLPVRPLFALAALLFAMTALPQRAHASYTVLIEFGPDIAVSSTIKGYEKLGQCMSFSFSSARETGGLSGSGGDLPLPTHTEITLTRLLDGASPKIWQRVLNGKVVPQVRIVLVSDAGLKLAEIKLTDVFITSYSVSGSSGGDATPYEQFGLTYRTLEYTVIPADPKTGKPGAAVTFSWDVAQNTKP